MVKVIFNFGQMLLTVKTNFTDEASYFFGKGLFCNGTDTH